MKIVLALMMRVQLAEPENDFLSAELYNQAFAVHGSAMMLLFAIPVFETIIVTLTPQMLPFLEPDAWLAIALIFANFTGLYFIK